MVSPIIKELSEDGSNNSRDQVGSLLSANVWVYPEEIMKDYGSLIIDFPDSTELEPAQVGTVGAGVGRLQDRITSGEELVDYGSRDVITVCR